MKQQVGKLNARVAKLVDAPDLGSGGVIPVRVQVSPFVPNKKGAIAQ